MTAAPSGEFRNSLRTSPGFKYGWPGSAVECAETRNNDRKRLAKKKGLQCTIYLQKAQNLMFPESEPGFLSPRRCNGVKISVVRESKSKVSQIDRAVD